MAPVLYIMCGLSFAGKSTLAKRIAQHNASEVVWRDGLYLKRDRLAPGLRGMDEWWAIQEAVYERVAALLRSGVSVVCDDLNVQAVDRERLRSVAREHGARTCVVYVETPISVIRERQRRNESTQQRGTTPEENFQLVLSQLEPPTPDENVFVYRAGDTVEAFVESLPH